MATVTPLDDEFTAETTSVPCPTCGPRCTTRVTRLYRNGEPIRGYSDGAIVDYANIEEARYVVRNKHVYFPGALFDLSDAELHQTMTRMSWLERGRALLHR